MQPKILLINPPWYRLFGLELPTYPLGLGYLAAVLKESRYDVLVYNADFQEGIFEIPPTQLYKSYARYREILNDPKHVIWKEVYNIIRRCKPDIVGLTTMTPKYEAALNVARLVKDINPKTIVIMGGPHPSALPVETAAEASIDVIIKGEGEQTLLEFVGLLDSGKWENIAGLAYKKGTRIVDNPDRPPIDNLDAIPFPAMYAEEVLLDYKRYPTSSFSRIFASRGCPFRCIYCSSHKVWGRRVRFRSPENILAEIDWLVDKYGISQFYFEDDTFGLNQSILSKFCQYLKSYRKRLRWLCELRPGLLPKEMYKLMREANCEGIAIGVESGEQVILDSINKDVSIPQVLETSRAIKDEGISLTGYFMFGFPWDSRQSILKSIDFMHQIDPDVATYSIATAYPGTELYDTALKEGLLQTKTNWGSFFHQSSQAHLLKKISEAEFLEIFGVVTKEFDRHNRWKKITHFIRYFKDIPQKMQERGYLSPSKIVKLLRYYLPCNKKF